VIDNEDSLPLPAVGEETPLQAILVADRVNEEEDVEAQVQAGIRQILQNTPMAVILPPQALKSEDIEAGKTRKKICILAGVLVIAGVISVALGIPLSKPPPNPDPIELFRKELVSISGERLGDKDSPQYHALDWIAHEDPAKTSVNVTDPEIIKQRYVAAVIYFALGGKGWTNQYNFCSGDDICLWNQNELSGIICGSLQGNVESLNLSKLKRLGSMAMSPRTNALTSSCSFPILL
jgi:hypothetical protein